MATNGTALQNIDTFSFLDNYCSGNPYIVITAADVHTLPNGAKFCLSSQCSPCSARAWEDILIAQPPTVLSAVQ